MKSDAAVDGQDGRIIWSDQCRPDAGDQGERGSTDFYATRLIMVAAGAVLATISQPTTGKDGTDVYGRAVTARAGKPALKRRCEGCHYSDDGLSIIADASGILHVTKKAVIINEVLEVRGNVDFSTGHIQAPGDVNIRGHVADLFTVNSSGSVLIGSDVNAGSVRASGTIEIRGALSNHRKGICAAGKDVQAGLVENSILVAHGDVRVLKEAVGSDILAGGAVTATAVRGGEIVATGGLDCKMLGSPASVRTLVVAGYDWMLPPLLAPITAAMSQLAEDLNKRQEMVKTLRDNRKRLSAQQKETLTEMEFSLSEQISKMQALKQKVDDACQASAARCRAEVMVRHEVQPGVEMRLGTFFIVTTMPMVGPVTFQVIGTGSTASIAAVEPGARPLLLPTKRIPDPMAGVSVPELPPN